MFAVIGAGKRPGHYHQELSEDSYHQERGQAALLPGGKLGQKLVPVGEVTAQVLNNLFAGYNADKTKKLVHQTGPKRHKGLDAVLAAPKWVSVLFALLPPVLRELLCAWVLAAARATMEVAENEIAFTRRGAGGRRVEHAAGIVCIYALHPAARSGVPHLHVHVLIPNECLRTDGTTGALNLDEFFLNRRLLTTIFHEELARRIERGFGLKLKPAKIGYDLVLPEDVAPRFKALCCEWSVGRRAIEEYLTRQGKRGGEAADLAQKKLRPAKKVERYEELFTRWRSEAKAHAVELDDLMPLWRELLPGRAEKKLQPSIVVEEKGPIEEAPTSERTLSPLPAADENPLVRDPQLVEPDQPFQVSSNESAEQAPEPRPGVPPPSEPVTEPAATHEPELETGKREQEAISHPSHPERVKFFDPGPGPVFDPEGLKEISAAIASDLTRRRNFFSERGALKRVTEIAAETGIPTATLVSAMLKYLKESDAIVRLGRNKHGLPFFTTREVYLEEKRLIDLVTAAAKESAKPFSAKSVEAATLRSERARGKELSDVARKALHHLAASSRPWTVLVARHEERTDQALEIVKHTAEAEGLQVLGAAATAQDAAALQRRTGIPAQSLHKWLLDHNRRTFEPPRDQLREVLDAIFGKRLNFDRAVGRFLERGVEFAVQKIFGEPGRLHLSAQTLLVVSGTQKLPVSDLADLLELARHSGARVLFVGHEHGLPSIHHPGAFEAIARALPHATLPPELNAAGTPIERVRALLMRRGPAAVLHELTAHGRLSISETDTEALQKLIADWKVLGAKHPREHVILTTTRRAAHEANLLAQAARRKALRIAPFHWLKVGDYKIRQGDRVVFRHGLRLKRGFFPRRVKSGEHGRVVGVDIWSRRIQVKTDKGLLVTFDPKKFQPIQLAYARTIHRGELLSSANVYALLEGDLLQSLSAKLLTARSDIALYTSTFEAGEPLKHLIERAQRRDDQPLASSHERGLAPEPKRHPDQPLQPRLKRGF